MLPERHPHLGLVCNAQNVCEQEQVDACDGVDCSGHGDCALLQGAPVCVCDPGYHADGLACVEDVVDPCLGEDCSGHGTCEVVSGNASCICEAGYHAEGLACVEDIIDPCQGQTCSGHGQCALLAGVPVCVCEAGYHASGADLLACEEDVNLCAGQTCSGHGICATSMGQAYCVCEAGYHAEAMSCVQNDIDSPCEGVDCSGHGTCVEVGGLPVCNCDPGYHAESTACIMDDPCLGEDCSGHGLCAVAGEEALCVCDQGYHADGLSCVADDPCQGQTCSGHGTCVVVAGAAECVCDAGYHAVGLACVEDQVDLCEDIDCSGHGFCAVAGEEALCVCDAGYHAEGLACVEDGPECFFGYQDDFGDGTVEPWVVVSGDVSVADGRLRVVRTGTRWGEVNMDLSAEAGGALAVEADLELLTSQSVVSICLQKVGTPSHMVCLTLNTKTENGSTQGAHLFYDTFLDNTGMPAGSELIEQAFDPGAGVSHHLRLTRSEAGLYEVWVDGVSIGTALDTRLDGFDRLVLYGMQDSGAGHGGFFDNLDFCAGQPAAGEASSCADVAGGDGVYTLDPDGAGPNPAFEVYCADVGTAEPKAYLELVVTGGTNNYSYYLYGPTGQSVTCNWTKVRILDLPTMQMDSTDRRFATCTGGLSEGYSRWGIAGSCTSGNAGRMNIDLTGTPFRVNWEGGVSYQPTGFMPSGAITRNEDNGVIVEAWGDGYCGELAPVEPPGLLLTFACSPTAMVLEDMPAGVLSTWVQGETCSPGDNPTVTYQETGGGYGGSSAIATDCVGTTIASCCTRYRVKSFDVGPANTDRAYLEAFFEVSSDQTYYNGAYLMVFLYDQDGSRVGESYYYRPEGMGAYLVAQPGFVEMTPGSEAGLWRMDLSSAGANIEFHRLDVGITNYACVGVNSSVVDHLVLHTTCP